MQQKKAIVNYKIDRIDRLYQVSNAARSVLKLSTVNYPLSTIFPKNQ